MVDAIAPRIELVGVSRRFGERLAVERMDLVLEPGRIHALIGENGAGKSTALKMVAGLVAPSEGSVRIGGEPLASVTPRAAMDRGVGMVHQHFMLVEPFTALENLILGVEPVHESAWSKLPLLGPLLFGGRLDLDAARTKARALASDAGLAVNLDARVSDLAVGEKQRLEILRVLYRGAKAILLDEPTAVLSPLEVTELYATLRRLAERGHTIAVVTHRLDEVVRFADDVTTMRRGVKVHAEKLDADARERATETIQRLTRAMMGGDVPETSRRPPIPADAAAVLELQSVHVAGVGSRCLTDVNLTLRSGEVVGVAGIEGNGQRELETVLAGLVRAESGAIRLDGAALFTDGGDKAAMVRDARARGLVVVLDDRHHDEMILDATVSDNLVVGDLGAGGLATSSAVATDEAAVSSRRFERFAVEPRDPGRRGRELSGGNQQKVVMARALDRNIRALVLGQPTRGVDVGTAHVIHEAVGDLAATGAAVLVLSADLNELRALSHRIVVLSEGRIVAELPPSATDEAIGRAMLGVTEDGEAAA
ncbi:MAG: ATP-binding cassette domain-containing protein [Deltaproteobacteria bacterium]|nr:ATP-binding cassette domain-containing protein [Deltaproteobacteria bacterium]